MSCRNLSYTCQSPVKFILESSTLTKNVSCTFVIVLILPQPLLPVLQKRLIEGQMTSGDACKGLKG